VKKGEITLITHDSFVMSHELVASFEKQSGYKLKLLTAGDAGALTNRLILTKSAPIADAVFGIDNTFSTKAISAGILAGSLQATDYGDVCFNYDKYWFAAHHQAAPTSINQLTSAKYSGLAVVENPNTSSTGLAFLAATVDKFGQSNWAAYWQELKQNRVKIDDGWDKAYNVDFSGSAGKGKYPIVLSYATSPADEVRSNGESQTANILDGCFRQTEYAGILKGAKNPNGAKALINFLLSTEFQSSFPTAMYMYPIKSGVAIPASWRKYTEQASTTYGDRLNFNSDRAGWLDSWSKIFA
jgi:thiamine transport system substrate-binding protein